MYSLLLLTAFLQAPAAAENAGAGASPPEQVLASIDSKGKLTIVHVTCACYGPMNPEHTVTAIDPKGKEKIPVKVKTSSVVVTTAELPARFVEAYTVDGKALSTETLSTLLVKERTVLVAVDGKKLDPFHLQLYKEGTIVLVPPANTLNVGGGPGYAGVGVAPAPPVPVERIERPMPPDRKPN